MLGVAHASAVVLPDVEDLSKERLAADEASYSSGGGGDDDGNNGMSARKTKDKEGRRSKSSLRKS
jgi:hypothetical protein